MATVARILVLTWAALLAVSARALGDPLSSWNDGPTKAAILAFVAVATDPGNPGYVRPEDRIATFDNDGTLWVSHPLYTQGVFALDRVHALAPEHPEWKSEEPFAAILAGKTEAMASFTEQDWERIIAATRSWLATAKHPRFGRRYTELAYQPMLELLAHLRANGFTCYIVTGGGQEFVRAFSDSAYGIPPQQVVGSSIETKYEYRDGNPVLMRLPKVFFIDDHAGKAIGINLFIGKRPIAAFGNSDGDREMLEWSQAGEGPRLLMLVLHDDPKREYAYGPAAGLPDTRVGTFSESLMTEARKRGWTVVSMKRDWKTIFPWE
jgi:phosphoglycolate phosphatase-like HAD superfamily hydrolase